MQAEQSYPNYFSNIIIYFNNWDLGAQGVASRSKTEEERKGKHFTSHYYVLLLACPKLCASSLEKRPMGSHPWNTYRDLSKALFPLSQPPKTRKKSIL